MAFHYTPDTAALYIEEVCKYLTEQKDWYESQIPLQTEENLSKWYKGNAGKMQKFIIALQGILRRLEITNDITMNLIAEDISERIMAVRKDNLADRYVGIIVYYELKPRWQWRDDGLNPVACVGNVKGWPNGHREGYDWQGGMCDLGDGRFVADHPNAGPGCWVLGGEYVPIPVDLEEGKEVRK